MTILQEPKRYFLIIHGICSKQISLVMLSVSVTTKIFDVYRSKRLGQRNISQPSPPYTHTLNDARIFFKRDGGPMSYYLTSLITL